MNCIPSRLPALLGMTIVAFLAGSLAASDIDLSGFALIRGASGTEGVPFEDQPVSAQIQLGVDWRPSVTLLGHIHLLARDDAEGSHRGHVGIVQAYLEKNVPLGEDRLRIMGGAFFLPTSLENVDALWESPYTITPSALNSWFGEEFRPIGVDVSYTARRTLTLGATLFRGNDTFGALPVDRGFVLRDHWALLGEHLPSGPQYFTSVSADTDERLGYSGRVRWTSNNATFQAAYIDNRADGTELGDLLNWNTQFTVAGFDYRRNAWTVAGESGFGVTSVFVEGQWFPSDLRASYLLISRSAGDFRFTLRSEEFRGLQSSEAIAGTVFWSPRGKLRTGLEVLRSGGRSRVALEFRLHFRM